MSASEMLLPEFDQEMAATQDGRQSVVHGTATRSPAAAHQPPEPPSRSDDGVSPAARCTGAFHLWTDR
jgi:hypothetical protein